MSKRGKSKSKTLVSEEREPKQLGQEHDDREHGLWVNEAFLRKHQNRPPILALVSEPPSLSEDHYIELADIALGLKRGKQPKFTVPPLSDEVENPSTAPKRYHVGRRAKPRTKSR